jgi:DNA-binding NarL/FixJ family response regulator
MRQITVVLALASPVLHAKFRTEVLMDNELALIYDAGTPAEAIAQTRLHQPEVVLCDRGMLADGQMIAIAQQTRVVSLLVLVTLGDESKLPRVPVPVAGTIPSSHRPGDLADRLQVIINSPAAFLEPGVRLSKHLAPPSERVSLEPLAYDASRIPSLPRSGRLMWLSDQQQQRATPSGHAIADDLSRAPLLKSVFDLQEHGETLE